MPPAKGPGGRKKDAIHFVNARPSSEVERAKIQRLVRAHVGKWISDQTKDRTTGISDPSPDVSEEKLFVEPPSHPPELETDENLFPSSSSPSIGSSPRSTESSSTNTLSVVRASSQNKPSVVVVPPSQSDSSNPPRSQSHKNPNGWPVGSDDDDPDSPNSSDSGEYIEVIGANVLDPFQTYPSRFSPAVVHACESYCLTVLWPGLTPGSNNNSSDVLAASNWFPLSLTEPTLFTAFLFGSLSHQRVQWVNRWIPEGAFVARDQQLLQICEMETIKMINREVQNPNRAVCDAVILSVMCMAHSVAEDNDHRRQRMTSFTAPMRRLQWLDVYGSLPPNLVHIQGLIQMVNLRGGLDNISLPGLAPILSFSDIVTSTTYLTPPVFGFFPLRESRRNITLPDLLGYTSLDAERHFGHLRQIGLTSDLIETYHAMHVYTTIVEGHLQNNPLAIDESLLADQRNLVHFKILSLPTASQIDGFNGYQNNEIIYEACRLAGLIFSVGVILPLPAQSSPLAQLATLIKALMQFFNTPAIWSHPHARVTLLWVLTLGGIAAENMPERAWYVSLLRQSARQNCVSSWSDLRSVLGMILWWDTACDLPGRNLWSEVEKSFIR
ncbi:hypothetical protein FE257_000145 [Aspergillus nanangensis]|uniref:Uncharacterized protein n=1 Tax=Aspergillus nanangensis TaxID=2582783 RepID=A0AAD4H106_ASPNN|nr:hypothetical protein FE257_000145 [Aspergillus nanangensis]